MFQCQVRLQLLSLRQGCNLYPQSNCSSSNGERHYWCSRTGACFLTRSEAEKCEENDDTTTPPSRDCWLDRLDGTQAPGWLCWDGQCIPREEVCDGFPQCNDGSDEARGDHQGCNSFPEAPGHCVSWFGDLYKPCEGEESLCTEASRAETGDTDQCRGCEGADHWRCDDGWCISLVKVRDGRQDCSDGSDEVVQISLGWQHLVLITTTIVLVGLLVPLCCRVHSSGRRLSGHGCLPPPAVSRSSVFSHRRDNSQSSILAREEEHHMIPSTDIPADLISLLENKSNNWDVRTRGRLLAAITRSRVSVSGLRPEVVTSAKCLYALLHNDSIRLHHLYMYLASRCSNVRELAKVTKHLFSWEMELHRQDQSEVLNCWRLRLGCSSTTSVIISSVTNRSTFSSRCRTFVAPVRDSLRNVRRKIMSARPQEDSALDQILSLLYFTLVPFLVGSLFYLEQIKNIIFAIVFWHSLIDYTDSDLLTLPFEFSLCLLLLLSIITTQCLFILYSYFYAEEIFEINTSSEECGRGRWQRRSLCYRTVATFLSPLMPLFILANYVYYDSYISRTRRHLQTLNDPSQEPISDEELRAREANQEERIRLYRQIYRLQSRRQSYRKLYSYYRLTSAVFESVTIIIVTILLMFVNKSTSALLTDTNNNYNNFKLIDLIEMRLVTFFGVGTKIGGELSSALYGEYLVKDIVIVSWLVYSLLVILTSLVKYWYQAKNIAMSWMGQTVLGFYLFFLLFNKLTTVISILSSSRLHSDHLLWLWSGLIFLLLLLVRVGLVYLYKRRWSSNWRSGGVLDKWINLVVNTLVIIPVTVSHDPVQELQRKEVELSKFSRRRSDPERRKEFLRNSANMDGDPGAEPGQPSQEEVRAIILKMWWKDTNRRVDVSLVKEKIRSKAKWRGNDLGLDRVIRETLHSLEVVGLINTGEDIIDDGDPSDIYVMKPC